MYSGSLKSDSTSSQGLHMDSSWMSELSSLPLSHDRLSVRVDQDRDRSSSSPNKSELFFFNGDVYAPTWAVDDDMDDDDDDTHDAQDVGADKWENADDDDVVE